MDGGQGRLVTQDSTTATMGDKGQADGRSNNGKATAAISGTYMQRSFVGLREACNMRHAVSSPATEGISWHARVAFKPWVANNGEDILPEVRGYNGLRRVE